VRDRFVQDGHRFYFPDGHPAFRDLGRKLTAPSENTQVVWSLIEIAHSRGWGEITVLGSERFREEAWRQGRLAGLNVRGFRPSDDQQAQLVRTLARSLARPMPQSDAVAEGAPHAQSSETAETRIAGQLLDHGKDAYRHDPNKEPSYFVRLKTSEGEREVWGRDIERAISKSLTQPQIGDAVILQRTGQRPVTVTRRTRGEDGEPLEQVIGALRNRWVLEKQEFFEERTKSASVVRNESVTAKEAVRNHPQLAGTYLSLRAAQLAADALRDPQDRRQFVRQVRRALADTIERGEPLQPVRLHERTARKEPRAVTR
jgi:putative DNA primase/helicase